MKNVTLVLSDGTKFHGKSFGYDAPVAGEVVFQLSNRVCCHAHTTLINALVWTREPISSAALEPEGIAVRAVTAPVSYAT